jgi:hypothetical protein
MGKLPKTVHFWKEANELHRALSDRELTAFRQFTRQLEELKDSGIQTLVVSSEYFCGDPWNSYRNRSEILIALRNFFKGNELVPILFLRRQDKLLESLWKQSVKQGALEGFEDFCACKDRLESLDFKKLVDAISTHLGVLPTVSDYSPSKDSVSEFWNLSELPKATLPDLAYRPNPGWPDHFIVLMQFLNSKSRVSKVNCRRTLDRIASTYMLHSTDTVFSSAIWKNKIQKRFQSRNRIFVESYMPSEIKGSGLLWAQAASCPKLDDKFHSEIPLEEAIEFLLVSIAEQPHTTRDSRVRMWARKLRKILSN